MVPAASYVMRYEEFSIRLDRLRFHARHGVLEQERVVGGDYEVSVELAMAPPAAAIGGDDLRGTVNYAEAYAVVAREMAVPSQLLEHVAGRILRALLGEFPAVERATVEVRKCNPPMGAACDGAAVRLSARR